VRKAENLPPSCADVKKSGGLNLLGPSGPVMGELYLTVYVKATDGVNTNLKHWCPIYNMPHTSLTDFQE
jgi:hypothetical protein